jgi:uridine kinase
MSPAKIAIDGPDAAGKTTLADELAAALSDLDRDVIRASIDGFHRPRAERYRRGRDSPAGYYEDSFNYPALRRFLLDPLSDSGDRRYRSAAFDHRRDVELFEPWLKASDAAILLFDGVFLLRPELAQIWDFRIFVSVSFDEALRRALERDASASGSRADLRRRYRERYLPGQRLYYADARPEEVAEVVVYNDDLVTPLLRE